MRGRKIGVEVSPRSDTVGDNGIEVILREGDFCRGGMVGHWCCSLAISE
jgi:hypothetical protein